MPRVKSSDMIDKSIYRSFGRFINFFENAKSGSSGSRASHEG